MNKADTPRVLASITAVTSVIAVVALSAAVFYDSIRWVSVGVLAAFVATRVDRYRVNQALTDHNDTISARDEVLHNRLTQIVTYWQADMHAATHGTPRPDPTALFQDQLPHPRQGDEELEREQQEQQP